MSSYLDDQECFLREQSERQAASDFSLHKNLLAHYFHWNDVDSVMDYVRGRVTGEVDDDGGNELSKSGAFGHVAPSIGDAEATRIAVEQLGLSDDSDD